MASPVFFNVLSRRKGSGLPFGNATIEAGAVGTDEHKADIQVQVLDWRSNPVAELPLSLLPKLEFLPDTQKGVAVAATLLNPVEDGEIQYDPTAKTDGDGKVLAGVILSRDLTDTNGNVGRVVVQLNTGKGAKPSNAINHDWVTPVWKMGENGDLEFHLVPNPGTSEVIVFRPKMDADVPVKDHVMKFKVTSVTVREWNENKTFTIERTYVIDTDASQPTDTNVIIKSTKDLAKYAHFGHNDDGTEDSDDQGNGTYRATVTIPESDDWLVVGLRIAAEDQGAYYKR